MMIVARILILQILTSLLFIFPYNVSIGDSSACSATSPCVNGACCSQWGSCGYGPDFCGKKCLSNCDAKAECGKYGKKETCPLNVCCSEFGFCGTTEEFCSKEKKCQNNCGIVQLSTCSKNDKRQFLGHSIKSI
jgi:chitinase